MKAIQYTRYGPPEVLRVASVPRPEPAAGEVLIQVDAASLNAADRYMIRGWPLPVRLMAGLIRPRHTIPGADVAGRVAAVGAGVHRLKPGDAVYGDLSGSGWGAFAEYVCAAEAILATIPAGVDVETAAALPLSAVAALQGLRDEGRIEPGQAVLVNGASGNLGIFAVQIANAFGAEVTGVCSPGKMALVRGVGAERVVDYTREEVTRGGRRFDLVFDTAAYRSPGDYRRILNPGGVYVMTGGSLARIFQTLLLGPVMSRIGTRKMAALIARPNRTDLETVGEHVAAGRIVPVIDMRFPLDRAADALRRYASGSAQGKIIITLR